MICVEQMLKYIILCIFKIEKYLILKINKETMSDKYNVVNVLFLTFAWDHVQTPLKITEFLKVKTAEL